VINILFLISSLERGGAENQLIELSNRMNSDEFKPHIITFQGMTKRPIALQNGVWKEVQFLGFKSISTLTLLNSLSDYCRKEKIDLIQSYFFTENLLAALISIITGIRHVISVRNLFPNKSLLLNLIQGFLLRRSFKILANAEMVKKRVLQLSRVNENKIQLIYNGIDTTLFDSSRFETGERIKAKERLGISADMFVVLMTANFRPEKNHCCLLKAIKMVKEVKPNVMAILVGDGPLKLDVERLSQDLMVEDNVYFAGLMSDILPFLIAADVGVLVSTHEGLSNALLEYMAAGIPIIASNVGGNREVVHHGETGFLFESDEYKALAEKILFLMDNKAETFQMGGTGREKVLKQFSMESMINNYEKFYIDAIL